MGKMFKSSISTAYGSNMNQITNYGNNLPAKKKLANKKIEDVSVGSLNSKFELAKRYFIYNFRDLSTSKICNRYRLNAHQGKILYNMLREFRKEYEHNQYGNQIKPEVKSELVRVIPTLDDRLSNIRIRYSSEDRSRNDGESISEGFVYLVENPAWPGWVKAGMTIDYKKRLSGYNSTYDPHNMYSFIEIKWVKNRKKAEVELLDLFESKADNRNGEWFRINKLLAIRLFNM